jgi:hypothetical protein
VRGLNGLISGLAVQLGQMAEQGLVGKDEPSAEPDAPEPEAEVQAPEPEEGDAPETTSTDESEE